MKFTKAQLSEGASTIYKWKCKGKSDRDISTQMNLPVEDYNKLVSAMLENKADELRNKPVEHTYVEYIINQIHNIKDLTNIINQKDIIINEIQKLKDVIDDDTCDAIIKNIETNTKRNDNSIVNAIRARSEIYDKIIKIGQDFGLIKREPLKKEVVAGVVVANLSNNQLKKAITEELAGLNKLMKRYGDDSILDMEPEELHYGPRFEQKSEKPALIGKTKRSKNYKAKGNKTYGGRKRVRAKKNEG